MHIALVEQTKFPTSLSKAEVKAYAKEVAEARAERNALLGSLALAVTNGQQEHALTLQEQVCGSPAVRRCAVLDAAKAFPLEFRPSLEACRAKASGLALDKSSTEVARFYPKAKSSGGYRLVLRPGLERRAQYEVVRAVLARYLKPRSFQFDHKGLQNAVSAAKQAMAGGHVYAACVDIEAFFEGFIVEEMRKVLPLRKELIENVVSGRRVKAVLIIKPGMGTAHAHSASGQTSFLQQARRGIPQGASCSPMVAGYCVSKLELFATPGVEVLNWVDDFLLLAKSQGELEKGIESLTKAIGCLPGGTFTLKPIVLGHVGQGFEFLGHRLISDKAGARVKLANCQMQRFYGRLNDLDAKLNNLGFPGSKKQADKIIPTLARKLGYVRGWENAFSECEDTADHVTEIVSEIAAYASSLGVALAELQKQDGYAEGYRRYNYTA